VDQSSGLTHAHMHCCTLHAFGVIHVHILRRALEPRLTCQEMSAGSICIDSAMCTLGMSFVQTEEEVFWQCILGAKKYLISSGKEGYGGQP